MRYDQLLWRINLCKILVVVFLACSVVAALVIQEPVFQAVCTVLSGLSSSLCALGLAFYKGQARVAGPVLLPPHVMKRRANERLALLLVWLAIISILGMFLARSWLPGVPGTLLMFGFGILALVFSWQGVGLLDAAKRPEPVEETIPQPPHTRNGTRG